MSDNAGLFSELRVVEVASMFMAPIAGTILADFGADVIKVEPPDGDPLRRIYKNPGGPRGQGRGPAETGDGLGDRKDVLHLLGRLVVARKTKLWIP